MAASDLPVRLAVLGAGMIGKRHIEHVLHEHGARLTAIVDPSDAAHTLARQTGTAWYPTFAAMISADRPDGVIIATPNHLHVSHGLDAVTVGLPALIEKPLSDNLADATRLIETAEKAGVPLLVGHHRRHNPLIVAAKQAITAGHVGQVVAVHGICWFYKPEEYFDVNWRREKGAGPVFLNLIHDVDLLRHLCGEVVQVQALESSTVRGNDVEDTAAILLRFANGALGSVTVSDTIVAPWSWEFTSGENPAYSHTAESCYMIGGTKGSLSIPHLDLWRHQTRPNWWEPIEVQRLPTVMADPLGLQIRNFCAVIRGTAEPIVSGREGLNTLKVIEAVKQSAATGKGVDLV